MKKFDIVIFDVDSTLVKIEGLDWLAEYKGKGEVVRELTKKSMEGTLNFNEAMIEKMKLISPDKKDLVKLGNVYCQSVVNGVKEVIAKLVASGIDVWIVTGNFEPAVSILADYLGIPAGNVICNEVYFGDDGKYKGFDSNNELAKNGGKARIIKKLFSQNKANKRIAYVGDGMTDLEVKDEVAQFIGFGGVVEREIVKAGADKYINGPSMYPLLNMILDD